VTISGSVALLLGCGVGHRLLAGSHRRPPGLAESCSANLAPSMPDAPVAGDSPAWWDRMWPVETLRVAGRGLCVRLGWMDPRSFTSITCCPAPLGAGSAEFMFRRRQLCGHSTWGEPELLAYFDADTLTAGGVCLWFGEGVGGGPFRAHSLLLGQYGLYLPTAAGAGLRPRVAARCLGSCCWSGAGSDTGSRGSGKRLFSRC